VIGRSEGKCEWLNPNPERQRSGVLLNRQTTETEPRFADARGSDEDQHMQQQTGQPFIIMQQVQPAFMQAFMQSQQPWIISQHLASPLVQVMTQPSFVISTLHIPIIRLQLQHMLHLQPAIILHRFCIIVEAVASSHTGDLHAILALFHHHRAAGT